MTIQKRKKYGQSQFCWVDMIFKFRDFSTDAEVVPVIAQAQIGRSVCSQTRTTHQSADFFPTPPCPQLRSNFFCCSSFLPPYVLPDVGYIRLCSGCQCRSQWLSSWFRRFLRPGVHRPHNPQKAHGLCWLRQPAQPGSPQECPQRLPIYSYGCWYVFFPFVLKVLRLSNNPFLRVAARTRRVWPREIDPH